MTSPFRQSNQTKLKGTAGVIGLACIAAVLLVSAPPTLSRGKLRQNRRRKDGRRRRRMGSLIFKDSGPPDTTPLERTGELRHERILDR